MQRENREFANKMVSAHKFLNSVFGSSCVIVVYAKYSLFFPFLLEEKRREKGEKSGVTIGAFSKYLRILGEVS